VLVEFSRWHPDTEVRVVTLFERLTVLRDVLSDGVELALLPRGGGVVAGPELVIEPFHREPLVLVVAPDHPLAGGEPPMLAEIARERFIVSSRSYSEMAKLDARLLAEGCGPLRVAMEISGDGIKELVRAGVGVAILLRCTVEDELARGELTVIQIPDADLAMDFVLVYDRARGLSPLGAHLADLLRARSVAPVPVS
jgi:DNA-binding transcriptional LysR family regulator